MVPETQPVLLRFSAFAPGFSWPKMTSSTTCVCQNVLQDQVQMFSLIFRGRNAPCSSEFIEFNIHYVVFHCPFYRLVYTAPHWFHSFHVKSWVVTMCPQREYCKSGPYVVAMIVFLPKRMTSVGHRLGLQVLSSLTGFSPVFLRWMKELSFPFSLGCKESAAR